MQFEPVGVLGRPVADRTGRVGGVPVHHKVDLAVEVAVSRSGKRHTTPASKVRVNTMKWMRTLVLIANIALTEKRLPVRRTIGVQPFGNEFAAFARQC
ncbi:hypothetical protein [Streptomyces sp. NPDC059909]|uniref:hypothetical protein n=1 Tax=Streptomyces sp. NPDC059909 TaxID=3346998 RepID=UPI00366925B7